MKARQTITFYTTSDILVPNCFDNSCFSIHLCLGGGVFKLHNGTWVLRGVSAKLMSFNNSGTDCGADMLSVYEDVNGNKEFIEWLLK